MRPIRRGDRGPAVAEIRAKLASLGLLAGCDDDTPARVGDAGDDGARFHGVLFDPACDRAVRFFQQSRGLSVDGIVGPETYRALDEARWRLGDRVLSLRVARPYVGDDVAELQHRLQELGFDPGRCDGVFGVHTEQATREFQRNIGLVPDGTCGPHTLAALRRLRRTVVGGRPQTIREHEELHRAGRSVAGKFVVIDPGHGGPDRGAAAGDLDEAAVAEDIAARLEGRLAASGAYAFLTRGSEVCPDESERAAFANAAEADLLVSLHCDAAPDPACNGLATYHFGSYGAGGRTHGSSVGAHLAGLVLEEILARTDLLDCRVHAKTWDLLRLTRMPAVRVELGYLTNPGDASRLAAPEFRDAVAEAIQAAVQRLYLPTDGEVATHWPRQPTPAGQPGGPGSDRPQRALGAHGAE